MTTHDDQLVVRQHERLLCKLPARLRVAEEHAGQVVIARSIGDGSGSLSATVVDCSRGGIGAETSIYLPRTAHVILSFPPRTFPIEGLETDEPLDFILRVQRANMTSREPRYYLGMAFLAPSGEMKTRIDSLLTYVRAHQSIAAEQRRVG